jgi:hypothetical protein
MSRESQALRLAQDVSARAPDETEALKLLGRVRETESLKSAGLEPPFVGATAS